VFRLKQLIKRIFDLCFALILFVILLPVLLIISLFIFFHDGKPILFRQKRPGKDEQIFTLIKFNTMIPLKTGQTTETNPDHTRITKLGSFLRRSSLDELPQLINVICGDISLVGPRPLLPEYLPLYNERQRKRHSVKPGITGWAQINGRNAISWEEKFELDAWYAQNWSLFLDFKILLSTFFKVFASADVNAAKNITMSKFEGTSTKK
jgi:lipopolysaccharide/colanic/teichoic acid biosynthesis glycosyltransferase